MRLAFWLLVFSLLPLRALADDSMPVQLDSCQGTKVDDYDVQVGIGFHATQQTATAVEFIFGLQDPFENVSSWYSGSTLGTFSPGVIIEPKRAALGSTFIPRRTDTQNTAWEMPYSSSGSYVGVRCVVYKVRLADGTVWTNPAFTNVYPTPAD